MLQPHHNPTTGPIFNSKSKIYLDLHRFTSYVIYIYIYIPKHKYDSFPWIQTKPKKLLRSRRPGAVSDQKAAVESHLRGINAPPEPFLGWFLRFSKHIQVQAK